MDVGRENVSRPKDRHSENEIKDLLDEYQRDNHVSTDNNFIPEHVCHRKINFVPTNPTGLAIFRAIPAKDALSSVAPWNNTELHMQMHIRDHLGFGGLYCIILEHSHEEILEARLPGVRFLIRLLTGASRVRRPQKLSNSCPLHPWKGQDWVTTRQVASLKECPRLLVALVCLICGVPEEQVLADFNMSEGELLAAKEVGVPKIVKYEVNMAGICRGS